MWSAAVAVDDTPTNWLVPSRQQELVVENVLSVSASSHRMHTSLYTCLLVVGIASHRTHKFHFASKSQKVCWLRQRTYVAVQHKHWIASTGISKKPGSANFFFFFLPTVILKWPPTKLFIWIISYITSFCPRDKLSSQMFKQIWFSCHRTW
jgi:hypothetical protein